MKESECLSRERDCIPTQNQLGLSPFPETEASESETEKAD
jgi:hypothetical protein